MSKALLVAPLVALLAGCSPLVCNAMYAPDTLVIELDGSYDPGAWQIEVSADSRTVLCDFTVGGDEPDALCTDGLEGEITFELDAEGGIASLAIWEFAPESAELTMRWEGAEVLTETLTPSYDSDEPNGEGCGFRDFATVTVAF